MTDQQAALIQIEIPVAWGDMDAFGHVNNTLFFKYCESARMRYFETIGLSQYMQDSHIGPILAKIQCKFIRPLFYPDTVKIHVTQDKLTEHSFELTYQIFSNKTQTLIAIAQDKIVTFNYKTQVKAAIPDSIRKTILELAHSANPSSIEPDPDQSS